MNGHVLEWLGAYQDGELSGLRLQHVESHLAQCAECQQELDGLRRLSSLLKTARAPEFMPVDRFTAQLGLQLPRITLETQPSRARRLLPWLVPAVLLGAFLFLRIVFLMSDVLIAASGTDLLGSALAWLSNGGGHSSWLAAAMEFFGSPLGGAEQSALTLADELVSIGAGAFGQFLWQAVIAILYLVWLAVWWLRRGQGQVVNESMNRV